MSGWEWLLAWVVFAVVMSVALGRWLATLPSAQNPERFDEEEDDWHGR